MNIIDIPSQFTTTSAQSTTTASTTTIPTTTLIHDELLPNPQTSTTSTPTYNHYYNLYPSSLFS